MSTTLEPNKEAGRRRQPKPALANGQVEPSPSQVAERSGFWRGDAPKYLRKGALAPDEAWNAYWSERPRRKSIARLCAAETSPVAWSIVGDIPTAPTGGLIALVAQLAGARGRRDASRGAGRRRLRAALAKWLDAARTQRPGYDLALGCLAAAQVLDAAGAAIDPALGWRLIDFLVETARHAQAWSPGGEPTAEEAVSQQMLAGELPLTLSYALQEMAPLAKLRKPGVDRLADGLQQLLNGEGLPRAAHLPALRALLACWTRARAITRQLPRSPWPKRPQGQFEGLVRQALRLTAPDGATLLAGQSGPWPVDLLRAALKLGGVKPDAAAAGVLLSRPSRSRKQPSRKKLPKASYHCEWSSLAVMRSGWSADDAVLAVDYSTPAMKLELWSHGRRILGGACVAESKSSSKPLLPTGAWEELCWFHDRDVDYLELSLPLSGGAHLERQVLLARRDLFLLLIDHLQSPQQADLEHAWQAPLGEGLLFCGEGETRDALLVDGVPVARAMPLALPEWRIDPRGGELLAASGALRLSQHGAARSLACPLFIDLCPQRSAQAATWRQLTVAESLQIQPADVAVAYRIQAGTQQWVYYRSQAARGNRSFLGQNTSSECVVARFKAPAGETSPLLEIEG